MGGRVYGKYGKVRTKPVGRDWTRNLKIENGKSEGENGK
jgi:hypothetical protein